MNQQVLPESDLFRDQLVFEGTVPLSIHCLDCMPDDEQLTLVNISNEKVLRMVAALDEMHIDVHEEPGHAHDIARLEFKINMLMDLVGQVIERQLELPARRQVSVNAHGIQIESPELGDLAPGQLLQVSTYFIDTYPRPVELIVSVTQSGADAVLAGQVVSLSEAVQDLLDRLIFRQHRRNIAQHRKTRS